MTSCAVFTDPTRAAPARWLEPPALSALAQQLYSKEQLTSAYDELTKLTFDRSFDPALLDPQQTYTADQLNAGVFERMTPALQERWTERVTSGLAGDAEAKDAVRLLRFFDWEQKAWRLPATGRPLIYQRIRNVEIGATPATEDTPQRLKVTLIVDAAMELDEGGVTFPMTVSKRVAHWLVPAKGGAPFQWKLDEYEGVFAVNDKLPVEKSAQTELPPGQPAEDDPGLSSVSALQNAVPAGQSTNGNRTASSAADAPPTGSPQTDSATGTPAPAPATANPPAAAPPATANPPVTNPPVTNPPTTNPPTTNPPTTRPPTTAPAPTTAPPTTASPTTAPPTTSMPTTAPTTSTPTAAPSPVKPPTPPVEPPVGDMDVPSIA